jgi:hypothetical protein
MITVNLGTGDARPQPREHIRALVSGYAPQERSRRQLAMLQAFIDDSGKAGPVFVAGGFVSSVAQWESFAAEWQAALLLQPEIPVFKMREAMARPPQGAFRSFSEEQIEHRLNIMVDIINKYTEHAVICSIEYEAYSEHMSGIAKTLDTPYFMGYYSTMYSVLRSYYLSGGKDKINFIFDMEHRTLATELMMMWDLLKKSGEPFIRRRLGSPPQWEDDAVVLPLQAADMLVWCMRRSIANSIAGLKPEENPGAKFLERLKVKNSAMIWHRYNMHMMRPGIPFNYENGKMRLRRQAEFKKLRGV